MQAREINATHQRAPKTRCEMRFVSTIGELEVFHTHKSTFINYLQWKIYASFAKLLN